MDYIQIPDLIEFSTDKRIRKKLLSSDKVAAELLCYEPGQSTPMHQHPTQDEVFFVVSGRGTIKVGDEEISFAPNSLLRVPAGTLHGLTASERAVLFFVKAPAFVSNPQS